MTYVTVRRATRAARAAAVILTAVSCSVYDASLLGDGTTNPGTGGKGSAGNSGAAGDTNSAGRAGSAGKADNGGASGSASGEGGMIDTAGAMDAGGEGPEGGTAGVGGAPTAGAAGSTGGSGGTSAGSGGTSAGSGGAAAGAGGSGGVTASGCAKLTVPLALSGDRAHFVISLSSAANLSSATTGIISMHLYVQAGAAGTIFNYVQDSQYRYFGVTTNMRPALKGLVGTWQTLTFNVGTQPPGSTGIDKTDIRRIGIEINAAPDTAGWSNPTIVYVDSITVMTPALSFPFETAATISTTPTGSDVAGQVMWQHNGSQDTTITTGVALAWQAMCP